MSQQKLATIRFVSYEAGRRILSVSFLEIGMYRFFNVPPELCAWFMRAPCKGTFFNAWIRDCYPFVKAATSDRGPQCPERKASP